MKHLQLTSSLYDYMSDISLREHEVLIQLRQETEKLPLSHMQVSPEQAQFMQFLLQMLQVTKQSIYQEQHWLFKENKEWQLIKIL